MNALLNLNKKKTWLSAKVIASFCAFFMFICAAGQQNAYVDAMENYNRQQYHEALNKINKVIAYDSSNADYYLLRAEIFLSNGEYEKAVPDCYKAIELNGNLAKINYIRAKISYVSGNYGISNMFLNKAMRSVQSQDLKQLILVEKAKVKLHTQEYQNAITDIQQALQMDTTVEALLTLAHAYTLVENKEGAKAIYKLVLSDDTTCYQAHMELTKIYMEDKNYIKALEYAQSACNIDDQSSVVNNYIGYIYYNLGNYPKALNHINKSLETDPDNFNAFKNRAMVYFKLSAINKACDDLFRSMQLGYIENEGPEILDIYKEECE